MNTSRRARRRALGSWLALAALGLLLFAPTVSRTLQAFAAPPAQLDCSHGMRGHAGMPMPMPAGSHDHVLDACGYCSLLHDSPALPWAVATLPPAPPARAASGPCRLPRPPILRPLEVCSRGPPLA